MNNTGDSALNGTGTPTIRHLLCDRVIRIALFLWIIACPALVSHGASLSFWDEIPGLEQARVASSQLVSGDFKTVIFTKGYTVYRWVEGQLPETIFTINGSGGFFPRAISLDGRVVVGQRWFPPQDLGNPLDGSYWKEGTGLVTVPRPPGARVLVFDSVSGDGSVLCGYIALEGAHPGYADRAGVLYYTRENRFLHLPSGSAPWAETEGFVSDDGKSVAGYASRVFRCWIGECWSGHAWYWNEESGSRFFQGPNVLQGGQWFDFPSGDGKSAFGAVWGDEAPVALLRWTERGGLQKIWRRGVTAPLRIDGRSVVSAYLSAVTADGTAGVGSIAAGDENEQLGYGVFWAEGVGFTLARDMLASEGVDTNGMSDVSFYGISRDGQRVWGEASFSAGDRTGGYWFLKRDPAIWGVRVRLTPKPGRPLLPFEDHLVAFQAPDSLTLKSGVVFKEDGTFTVGATHSLEDFEMIEVVSDPKPAAPLPGFYGFNKYIVASDIKRVGNQVQPHPVTGGLTARLTGYSGGAWRYKVQYTAYEDGKYVTRETAEYQDLLPSGLVGIPLCYGELKPLGETRAAIREEAVASGVPPLIAWGISWHESGYAWQQYRKTPSLKRLHTIVTHDGGIGMMQLTHDTALYACNPEWTGNRTLLPENTLEHIYKLAADLRYNLSAGLRVLQQKKAEAESENRAGGPLHIGTGSPEVLEHWYNAIWAYNGLDPKKGDTYPARIWSDLHVPPARVLTLGRPKEPLWPAPKLGRPLSRYFTSNTQGQRVRTASQTLRPSTAQFTYSAHSDVDADGAVDFVLFRPRVIVAAGVRTLDVLVRVRAPGGVLTVSVAVTDANGSTVNLALQLDEKAPPAPNQTARRYFGALPTTAVFTPDVDYTFTFTAALGSRAASGITFVHRFAP